MSPHRSPVQRVRVLLVDDHAIVRAGLRAILGEQGDIDIAAECEDAESAAEWLTGARVDVVLLDLSLPGHSGWKLLEALRRGPAAATVRVLVVSSHREEEYAIQALRSGAAGYLSKDAAVAELVSAVRRVAAGHRYVSPEIAERLARSVVDGESTLDPHEALTPREFSVFMGIVRGRSLVDIATELHVSPKTVTSWRARVLDKLGLENNAALTRYATRKGLLGQ